MSFIYITVLLRTTAHPTEKILHIAHPPLCYIYLRKRTVAKTREKGYLKIGTDQHPFRVGILELLVLKTGDFVHGKNGSS